VEKIPIEVQAKKAATDTSPTGYPPLVGGAASPPSYIRRDFSGQGSSTGLPGSVTVLVAQLSLNLNLNTKSPMF
jgi:hypothetical protein